MALSCLRLPGPALADGTAQGEHRAAALPWRPSGCVFLPGRLLLQRMGLDCRLMDGALLAGLPGPALDALRRRLPLHRMGLDCWLMDGCGFRQRLPVTSDGSGLSADGWRSPGWTAVSCPGRPQAAAAVAADGSGLSADGWLWLQAEAAGDIGWVWTVG